MPHHRFFCAVLGDLACRQALQHRNNQPDLFKLPDLNETFAQQRFDRGAIECVVDRLNLQIAPTAVSLLLQCFLYFILYSID